MGRFFPAAFLVAAVVLPGRGVAHRFSDRELVIQIDDRGAAALWRAQVVGPEAALLRAVWDRNRDGALAADERTGLAVALLARASRGVELTWDGQAMTRERIETRLDDTSDRSVTAQGLATFHPPPGSSSDVHVLRIEVGENSGPLTVLPQVLGGWQWVGADLALAPDGRGLARPLVLEPGRAVEMRVVRRARRPLGDK